MPRPTPREQTYLDTIDSRDAEIARLKARIAELERQREPQCVPMEWTVRGKEMMRKLFCTATVFVALCGALWGVCWLSAIPIYQTYWPTRIPPWCWLDWCCLTYMPLWWVVLEWVVALVINLGTVDLLVVASSKICDALSRRFGR